MTTKNNLLISLFNGLFGFLLSRCYAVGSFDKWSDNSPYDMCSSHGLEGFCYGIGIVEYQDDMIGQSTILVAGYSISCQDCSELIVTKLNK